MTGKKKEYNIEKKLTETKVFLNDLTAWLEVLQYAITNKEEKISKKQIESVLSFILAMIYTQKEVFDTDF